MKASAYLAVWLRLLTRTPEDLAAEKQVRHPSPAPHRKQGTKQAPQRTQTGGVPLPYHSEGKTPYRARERYSCGTVPATYLQESGQVNFIHDEAETAE